MGAIGAFGRSKARRVEGNDQQVTFKDVAGSTRPRASSPRSSTSSRTPRSTRSSAAGFREASCSRAGPARARRCSPGRSRARPACRSSLPPQFVEAIVGIGASRVRDLFKQAKEAAPAIIFIDELDAIGRSRSGGNTFGGGNDKREQTLNQILTEMDGFEPGDTVIVLGATNRAEILDAALLRPGRFDRRVTVPPPDKDGRKKILEVHTR